MTEHNLAESMEHTVNQCEPIVKQEFEKFLAPLPEKEFKELKADILERGCRDPLVTWRGYLLDGHHRLKICKENDIPYQIVAYEFEYGEVDAKIWIARNQKNRRNLTSFCKVRLELQLKDLYLERNKKIADEGRDKGRENSSIYFKRSAQISAPTISKKEFTQETPERDYSGNTAYLIAENAGVSHDTVHKVEKIIELSPPEIIKQLEVKAGKMSINAAFNELNNTKKRDAAEIVGFPTDKFYDVIYCDPYFRSVSNPTGWGQKETVISKEELPINSAMMGEGMLFIWTPTLFLDQTLDLAKKWGFTFRDFISWELDEVVETKFKPINQNQMALMVCSAGRATFWDFQEKPLNLIRHNLSHEGSRYEQAREIIDRLIPQNKNRLEMFSPHKKEGWDLFTGTPVN